LKARIWRDQLYLLGRLKGPRVDLTLIGIKGVNVMVKFQEIDVIRFLFEMLFKEDVDCALKHKRIVDSNSPDMFLLSENSFGTYISIPTRLSSPRNRVIHYIIRHKEKCLQLN
jgi:hypothetical protein